MATGAGAQKHCKLRGTEAALLDFTFALNAGVIASRGTGCPFDWQDARRSLLNQNGHLNGVGLTDGGFYYYTNGNGTWVQARALLATNMMAPLFWHLAAVELKRPASMVRLISRWLITRLPSCSKLSPLCAQAMSQAVSIASEYPGSSVAPGPTNYKGIIAPLGLASVTFPSKTLGIAVGAAPTIGPIVSGLIGSLPTTSKASQAQFLTTTPSYLLTIPTILLTFDGAQSWAAATGARRATLPGSAPTPGPASDTPLTSLYGTGTLFLTTSFSLHSARWALRGLRGSERQLPPPRRCPPARRTGIPQKTPLNTPDLSKVYCASKLLCWAVGGIYGAATSGGNGAALITTKVLPATV